MATTTSMSAPVGMAAITPNSKLQRGFSTASTYNTALSTLSAKADITGTDGKGNPGVSDPATGRVIITTPPGSLLEVLGIGAADNGTFSFRIWGWYAIDNGTMGTPATRWQLTPRPLALIAATVGAKVGIANGIVTASEGYVDTMTITTDYGISGNGVRIVGPGTPDNTTESVLVDPMGADFIEIEATRSGGTATSFDFLIRGVSGV